MKIHVHTQFPCGYTFTMNVKGYNPFGWTQIEPVKTCPLHGKKCGEKK